ncbi:MAG: hypothetical protein RAO94_09775 [Candidatus Stygibacter australis]|nr:hypothetical protein [Candidatus Stygibacter australis]
MRKVLVLFIFVVLLMGVMNAETKLSMELWSRWSYLMLDGADEALQNELSLARGYFGLEQKFTDQISGRFLADFFSKGATALESDEMISNDGAGLKLKLAYVKFSDILWKNSNLIAGLQLTYFGTLYDWGYATIDLNPTDMYGFVSSCDYGITLGGTLPMGICKYHLGVYNGEGYTKSGNQIDNNMAYLGDLRITPFEGITLGGSYYMNPADGIYYNGVGEEIDYDIAYNKMAGFVRINMFKGLDLWAQYLSRSLTTEDWNIMEEASEETDLITTALSIMPIINIKEFTDVDAELVFRYDIYDDNTDMDDDVLGSMAHDLMIAGINYYLLRDDAGKAKMWVQANYSMMNYKYEDYTDASIIKIQLRWKFSELLK